MFFLPLAPAVFVVAKHAVIKPYASSVTAQVLIVLLV